jgi:adenosylcobyric acid synthase
MLGRSLADPLGLEGEAGTAPGLGWLEIETELKPDKQVGTVSGHLDAALGGGAAVVSGYEIHMGVSWGAALQRPALWLESAAGKRADGALSADGQILGTYVHGLFDAPQALSALLAWAGLKDVQPIDLAARREADIERLADALETSCAIDALFEHRLPTQPTPSPLPPP